MEFKEWLLCLPVLLGLGSQFVASQGLVGFWPFNCDHNASDVTGTLDLLYDPSSSTAPEFVCRAEHGLKGAVSFAGNTTKYLKAVNPGNSVLGFGYEITWIGYIMVPHSVFADPRAPIFSFEKERGVTRVEAAIGFIWSNSFLTLAVSSVISNGRYEYFSLPFGTGMSADTWYKMVITARVITGYFVLRVVRLSDNAVAANIVSDQQVMQYDGLLPYVDGEVRFGAYVETNNNGNDNFFRGFLSCVQLYNKAINITELDEALAELPAACAEPDECENVTCFNNGTCIDGYNSYTCACAEGYTDPHCQTSLNEQTAEEKNTTVPPGINYAIVAVPIACLVLMIILAIAGYVMYMKRKKRRERLNSREHEKNGETESNCSSVYDEIKDEQCDTYDTISLDAPVTAETMQSEYLSTDKVTTPGYLSLDKAVIMRNKEARIVNVYDKVEKANTEKSSDDYLTVVTDSFKMNSDYLTAGKTVDFKAPTKRKMNEYVKSCNVNIHNAHNEEKNRKWLSDCTGLNQTASVQPKDYQGTGSPSDYMEPVSTSVPSTKSENNEIRRPSDDMEPVTARTASEEVESSDVEDNAELIETTTHVKQENWNEDLRSSHSRSDYLELPLSQNTMNNQNQCYDTGRTSDYMEPVSLPTRRKSENDEIGRKRHNIEPISKTATSNKSESNETGRVRDHIEPFSTATSSKTEDSDTGRTKDHMEHFSTPTTSSKSEDNDTERTSDYMGHISIPKTSSKCENNETARTSDYMEFSMADTSKKQLESQEMIAAIESTSCNKQLDVDIERNIVHYSSATTLTNLQESIRPNLTRETTPEVGFEVNSNSEPVNGNTETELKSKRPEADCIMENSETDIASDYLIGLPISREVQTNASLKPVISVKEAETVKNL